MRAMYCLKDRAKTYGELLDKAHFVLASRPLDREPASRAALEGTGRAILAHLTPLLHKAEWKRDTLEATVAQVAGAHGLGLGKLAPVLRAALAGRMVSPSVFDMMLVIGRDETIARLEEAMAS